MTVETTTFLPTAKITYNSREKSIKFLKNHKILIVLTLSFTLLLFCATLSILQMYVFSHINGMQQEINQLKSEIYVMRQSMGFDDDDLFDELSDFDNRYNQNEIKDEIDSDGSNISSADDKNTFDDVGDDNEESSEEVANNYDEDSGYGQEDEHDFEPIDDRDESEEAQKDNNNIYKDMKFHVRKARSIAGLTQQGIPILEEPYDTLQNQTRRPLAEDYVTNILSQNDPKLKLTWSGSRRESVNQHNARRHHHHQHNTNNSNRFAFDAAAVQPSYEYHDKNVSGIAQSSIQTRRSRVMHVEDRSKAFRQQVVRKDDLIKLAKSKEFRKSTHDYMQNLNNPRRHMQNPLRRNLQLKNGKRTRITAVHFNGDSSHMIVGRHHNYLGNGKVKLNKNEYINWQQAEWVNQLGMDKFFNIDNTSGVLLIKDSGIFMIYAQIFYSDEHDTNGYEIYLNNRAHYQCTTMTHTTSRITKTNSCYTSGLMNLKNGDKIQIKDIGNHRFVLLEPSKSYFGLIKINIVPHVSHTENSSEAESLIVKK